MTKRPKPPENNTEALERYLGNVYPDGTPAEHLPIVQVVISLALAVDDMPENSALWREYRAALQDLESLHTLQEEGLDAVLTRMQTSHSD